MSPSLKIAWRGVFRHKKRSAIAVASVAFGLGAVIFLRSFIHGAQNQMVANITATLTGDAQIVPASQQNLYETNFVITNPADAREILREEPAVIGLMEKVVRGGIVASPTASMMTFIVGVDPQEEKLIGTRRTIISGNDLASGTGHEALVGEAMRKILGVEVGEKIVVTAEDEQGELTGEAFTLTGTFATGNDQIDNGTVIVPKQTIQHLLSWGERISKFQLKLNSDENPQQVFSRLGERLTPQNLKIISWQEVIPMLAQMLDFQNGMTWVVLTIVLVVVTVGILNTLMMSLLERVREFGLMLALGTPPLGVLGIVLIESLLLSASGAILAVLLGWGLTAFFGMRGIDLTPVAATLSNFMIGSHVFPTMDWGRVGLFVPVVILVNLVVAMIPAWKAGRLQPVEAMR